MYFKTVYTRIKFLQFVSSLRQAVFVSNVRIITKWSTLIMDQLKTLIKRKKDINFINSIELS